MNNYAYKVLFFIQHCKNLIETIKNKLKTRKFNYIRSIKAFFENFDIKV